MGMGIGRLKIRDMRKQYLNFIDKAIELTLMADSLNDFPSYREVVACLQVLSARSVVCSIFTARNFNVLRRDI